MHEDSLFLGGQVFRSVPSDRMTADVRIKRMAELLTSYHEFLLVRKLQVWGLVGVEPKNFSIEGSIRAARVTNPLTIACFSFFSLLHCFVLSQFPTSSLRFIHSFLFLQTTLYSFPLPIFVRTASFPYFVSTSPYCFYLSILLIFLPNSIPFCLFFIPFSSYFSTSVISFLPHTCHLCCFDVPFVFSLFLPFFFLLNILSPFLFHSNIYFSSFPLLLYPYSPFVFPYIYLFFRSFPVTQD